MISSDGFVWHRPEWIRNRTLIGACVTACPQPISTGTTITGLEANTTAGRQRSLTSASKTEVVK